MPTLIHKHGDSFRAQCTYTVGGTSASIAGLNIASQIRNAAEVLVCSLEVYGRDDGAGTFSLRPSGLNSAETDWPVDTLYWDIQYTDANGLVRSTETITINVVRDETR